MPTAPTLETFNPTELTDRVAVWMLFEESVTIEQVRAAWEQWKAEQQEGETRALWRALAEQPGINEERAYAAAARVYSFDKLNLPKKRILSFISKHFEDFSESDWQRMAEMGVLPVNRSAETDGPATFTFAAYDPTRPGLLRLLRDLGHAQHELRYAPKGFIDELIDEALDRRNEFLERVRQDGSDFDLAEESHEPERLMDDEQLAAEITGSKLINLFEAMLVEAVRRGASDVHIYPNADRNLQISFRINGQLEPWPMEQQVDPEAFLTVVKDQADGIDRFERDDAQDGSLQRNVDDTDIRFRVSVLPIANSGSYARAESVVIRVLDDRKVIKDLGALGLDDRSLGRFEQAIHQPYGMVMLTGPTGSGKTTTLYAALQQVVKPSLNVLTVEDPVEYLLPGVRQIRLNQRLRVERALRSILRHDPDVVMVGEMRDRPTAELGVKLANTGHLTFSTLHTNDAPAAISRLYKMGVEPFLLAYSINLIVAQRLIRTLCSTCRQEATTLEGPLLEQLGFSDEDIEATTFFKPGNDPDCPSCQGAGYTGRRAIGEALLFSPAIRQLILTAGDTVDEKALRNQALEEGMHTLQDAARAAVKRGETSVSEMQRVVFTQ